MAPTAAPSAASVRLSRGGCVPRSTTGRQGIVVAEAAVVEMLGWDPAVGALATVGGEPWMAAMVVMGKGKGPACRHTMAAKQQLQLVGGRAGEGRGSGWHGRLRMRRGKLGPLVAAAVCVLMLRAGWR